MSPDRRSDGRRTGSNSKLLLSAETGRSDGGMTGSDGKLLLFDPVQSYFNHVKDQRTCQATTYWAHHISCFQQPCFQLKQLDNAH